MVKVGGKIHGKVCKNTLILRNQGANFFKVGAKITRNRGEMN